MGITSGILMGVSTAGQFLGQQRQAGAIDAQSSFDQKLASMNAADAVARGNLSANRVGMQTRGIIGSQRANFAAQGIDPNAGSAADTQVDTSKFGALDEMTIRNNAAREAWGITTNAGLQKSAASQESASLRASSYDTLITGAAKTYGLYRDGVGRQTAAQKVQANLRGTSPSSKVGVVSQGDMPFNPMMVRGRP